MSLKLKCHKNGNFIKTEKGTKTEMLPNLKLSTKWNSKSKAKPRRLALITLVLCFLVWVLFGLYLLKILRIFLVILLKVLLRIFLRIFLRICAFLFPTLDLWMHGPAFFKLTIFIILARPIFFFLSCVPANIF